MGLKTTEVQAIANAAQAAAAAYTDAAIAGNAGYKTARFHITHQGGGGDFELTSDGEYQTFVHPVALPAGGFLVGKAERVNVLAVGIPALTVVFGIGFYGEFSSNMIDYVTAAVGLTAKINGSSRIDAFTHPEYYTPGPASFDTNKMKFSINGGPAQLVTFAAPTDATDVASQVNAQTMGLVATIFNDDGSEYLRLASDDTGQNATMELLGFADNADTAGYAKIGTGEQFVTGSSDSNSAFELSPNPLLAPSGGLKMYVSFYGGGSLNLITAFDAVIDFIYLDPATFPVGA